MISRTYTVTEGDQIRGYKGFDRNFRPSQMEMVALVQVEDQIEVFVLDNHVMAKTELVRFLCEEDAYAGAVVVGIYSRI